MKNEIYNQYFFWSSLLEKCKEDLQTKVYYKLFYSISGKTFHEFLKVIAAKKSLPSMFIIDMTCFDECFLFHVITGNNVFYTSLLLPRDLT